MVRPLSLALAAAVALTLTTTATAQTTYDVTVETKTAQHPYFGQGQLDGYVIDGIQGAEVVVMRGSTYTFQMDNVPTIHPFYITTSAVGAGEEPYTDGVTGNFATGNAVVTFTPSASAPELLYYQCGFHSNMGWKIVVQGTSSAIDEALATDGAAMLAWPNPVVDRSTIVLRSAASTTLHVTLYDLAGRSVRSLYDGSVVAGEQLSLALDAQGLVAGVYVVHASGEGISATTRIAVR